MKKFFNLVKQLGWVTQPVIDLPHRGKNRLNTASQRLDKEIFIPSSSPKLKHI